MPKITAVAGMGTSGEYYWKFLATAGQTNGLQLQRQYPSKNKRSLDFLEESKEGITTRCSILQQDLSGEESPSCIVNFTSNHHKNKYHPGSDETYSYP